MVNHIVEFDHRQLPTVAQPTARLACGVAACAFVGESAWALGVHRGAQHSVPRRVSGSGGTRLFGRCDARHTTSVAQLCLASHCRGSVCLQLASALLNVAVARDAALDRLPPPSTALPRLHDAALLDADPLPLLFSSDVLAPPVLGCFGAESQLLHALAEHDWPRVRASPPHEPARCSACLGCHDAHCMLRCGQRCYSIDDADAANADAAFAAADRLRGPNEPLVDADQLVYCGRSYHTYCMRPSATLIDAELVQEAYRRVRDFVAAFRLPRYVHNKLSVRFQIEGNIWRCTECALVGLMPRPYWTRDTRRLQVPVLDALTAVARSGHGSPYALRMLSLCLFHLTSFPHTMLRSLDATTEAKRQQDDDDNDDEQLMVAE